MTEGQQNIDMKCDEHDIIIIYKKKNKKYINDYRIQ